MLFNSYEFGLFFLVVTAGYFAMAEKFRLGWLLLASCVFYAYAWPAYLLVLFTLVAIDYLAGLAIARHQGWRRKLCLAISLLANLGILIGFKSFSLLGWPLPVGLSFHTFQAMSYTLEVYYGRCPPETHLGRYALYVLFYPQLVAGPIERPQNLLPQLRRFPDFDYDRVVSGLVLMAFGLFKKVAVADRLAAITSAAFSYPPLLQGPWLVLVCLLFGLQIYCDFCGYSDIARGSAQVMGFRLLTNFQQPFFARTLSDFWRRWHISLTRWFRDYVYLPLGGSARRVPLVLLVFALSGAWHGIGPKFVVWGLLLGVGLLAQEALFKPGSWWMRPSTWAVVTLSWIFFRSASWSDSLLLCQNLTRGWHTLVHPPALQLHRWDVYGTLLAVLSLALVEGAQLRYRLGRQWLAAQPWPLRYPLYWSLLLALLVLGAQDQESFLYFQF